MMKERSMLKLARALSAVCSPLLMTFVVFAFLLLQGYGRLLAVGLVPTSTGYLILLFVVLLCTYIVPMVGIGLYRRLVRLGKWELARRSNLNIPYVLTVLSYLACSVMLYMLNIPSYLQGVVVAALVSLMVCALLNLWWKPSTHMVALGGVTSVVAVCGLVQNFNPLWYLCLLFLFSGMVGSARIMLRQHTLLQVMLSYVIGVVLTAYFFCRGFFFFL